MFVEQRAQANKKEHQIPALLAVCVEKSVTGGFISQRANNAENISMPWREHVDGL